MQRNMIRLMVQMVLVLVLIGVSVPGQVMAEEPYVAPHTPPPNPMNVAADVLILRPVGIIMIPVTGLIYGLGYPFAKAAGNEKEVYQSLLGDTIDYTFHRPLGRGEPFD
jgi:hypothetical protein